MNRLLPVLLAVCALWPTLASAVTFEVPVQGSKELTVAVADPVTPAGDPNGVAARLRDTLEKDLDLTGYFEIVGTRAHIDRSGQVEPGTFPFDAWSTVRVAALVKLRVWAPGAPACDPSGAKMCVDVYVYDVLGQAKLVGKRLRGAPDGWNSLAHEAANVVLLALVGEQGFFRDVLVAVREVRGQKEVWLVDVTGDNPRAVTRNGAINLSPSWKPGGRTVAWTSYRRGEPDVWEKDLRTGVVRPLSARNGLEVSSAYSPDGQQVAIARGEDGQTDIWLVDARSGRDIRQLTTGGGIDVSPHFSPDGRTLVFASERSGGSQIYEVDVAGGTPRRVTKMGGFFTDPVYSPDGKRVAFVSHKGSFDVLTVNRDGTGLVRITQDMGDNEDPTWSPDGRYLVFSSTRDGASRLWLATANGRHQVRLTDTTGWSQPSWTP